jgi:hypothetical protein
MKKSIFSIGVVNSVRILLHFLDLRNESVDARSRDIFRRVEQDSEILPVPEHFPQLVRIV